MSKIYWRYKNTNLYKIKNISTVVPFTWFFDFVKTTAKLGSYSRKGKILHNEYSWLERAKSSIVSTLSPPRKIKDFQGLPLTGPWTFNQFNPWVDHKIPWKCYPCPCLEIQGFSRYWIDKPWTWIFSFSLTSTLIIKFLLFSRSLKTLDYCKNWNKNWLLILSLWIFPRF